MHDCRKNSVGVTTGEMGDSIIGMNGSNLSKVGLAVPEERWKPEEYVGF